MTRVGWNAKCRSCFLRAVFLFLPLVFSTSGHGQTHASITDAGKRLALYSAAGPTLTQYDVDIDNATLTMGASVEFPTNVQYAWFHPSHRFIYVAWSDRGSNNGLSAYRIDPTTGALSLLSHPVPLAARPIHLSTDIPGTHLFIGRLQRAKRRDAHRLGSDGLIGSEVTQPQSLDVGIYAHQVRVDPSNKMVILVTRGNNPRRGQPEDSGALKVFDYNDGVLTNRASIAPGGGYGFGPRHLDFWGPLSSYLWSGRARCRSTNTLRKAA